MARFQNIRFSTQAYQIFHRFLTPCRFLRHQHPYPTQVLYPAHIPFVHPFTHPWLLLGGPLGRAAPGPDSSLSSTRPPLPGLAPPPHPRARTKGEQLLQPACSMIEPPHRPALGPGPSRLRSRHTLTPCTQRGHGGATGHYPTSRHTLTPCTQLGHGGATGHYPTSKRAAGQRQSRPPPLYLCLYSADSEQLLPPSYWARTYHYSKARAAGLCRGVDTAGHCLAGPLRHITTPTATWSPTDQRQTTPWGTTPRTLNTVAGSGSLRNALARPSRCYTAAPRSSGTLNNNTLPQTYQRVHD